MASPYPQPSAPAPAPTSSAHLVPAVGLVACGLVGLIGGFLPWMTLTSSFGSISQSVSASVGVQEEAWLGELIGVIVLIAAATYLFGQRRSRGALTVAGIFSVALLGFGVWKIISVYQQIHEFFDAFDNIMNDSDLTSKLPSNTKLPNFHDLFHIYPGMGLWMVAGAGLLGVVLSGLALWVPKFRTDTGQLTYPPAPLTYAPAPAAYPPAPGLTAPAPAEPWARPEPPTAVPPAAPPAAVPPPVAPPPAAPPAVAAPIPPATAPTDPAAAGTPPVWHIPAPPADPTQGTAGQPPA